MTLTNTKEFIKQHIILIGIIVTLIVAIVLRFKGLTFQSHWLDELWSVAASNPSRTFSSMYDTTVRDVHPPLYQTLLWIWYHAFGFTEYAGRALSATIGTLGIYAIYLLGKEFFNKEVGLYAAIIATMNHFLIFYSQEVRSYGLLFLLSTMSYLYLIKVLTQYSKKNFILYLVFTVALVYTHYFGFFLVATQVFVFIYYFIKEKAQRKHLAILALITAVTIIVSLLPLMEHILSHEGKKSFWIKSVSEWFVIDYIKNYTRSQYLDGIFLLLTTMSLGYIFTKKEESRYKHVTIVLLAWILIGYLLPYIRSITAIPLLTSRNTIMILPALILLIAYGIYLIKDNILKVSALVIIIFFSWYQINISDYYHKVTKQQWREVLLSIKGTNEKMPIYAFMGGKYETYNSMLQLNLNIKGINNLKKGFEDKTFEKCFLVVDSHGNHIKDNKILKNSEIKKVLEIKKHDARGVLYAYQTSPNRCLEIYNGVTINVDFNDLNKSKPYKGNPLGMHWSGSVQTPVYALEPDGYTLIVNAKGSKAFDEFAKLKLEVFSVINKKSTQIAEKTVETTSKYTDYTLPLNIAEDTNISIKISFINDKGRKEPKEDRNVFLKSIVLKRR